MHQTRLRLWWLHLRWPDMLSGPTVCIATHKRCRDEGIPAAEVRVSPQPVTPELLLTSTRLNRTTAEAAVAALAAGGFLDAVRQPRRWFEVAHDNGPIRRG